MKKAATHHSRPPEEQHRPIFNNTAIKYLQDWAVYGGESCSDHIIQYALGDEAFQATESNISGKRYTDTGKHGEVPSQGFTNTGTDC